MTLVSENSHKQMKKLEFKPRYWCPT